MRMYHGPAPVPDNLNGLLLGNKVKKCNVVIECLPELVRIPICFDEISVPKPRSHKSRGQSQKGTIETSRKSSCNSTTTATRSHKRRKHRTSHSSSKRHRKS